MRGFNILLCLIPLLLLTVLIKGQNNSQLKNFLTIENGLSHNEVTSIVQDHEGFMWIGTRGGLNRYDGYEFKIFNQVPEDSNSLVNPSIESLFVDSKGNIWIGSKSGGVSKYNPKTETFTNIVSNYEQSSSIINSNRLLSFYEDKYGKIWIGTWNNGLVIYNQESNTSEMFLNGNINSITGITEEKVYVGGDFGLYEFNTNDYTYTRYSDAGVCKEIVYDDNRDVIWIVGGGGVLRKFDLRNKELKKFPIAKLGANRNTDSHSLESILLDKEGRIWVGTWGTGLYLFDEQMEAFSRYFISPENCQPMNRDYDTILDIFQDSDDNIWFATNGGGICFLTSKLNFNTVGYHPEPGKGLINTRLMSVLDDRNGNLWLGTIGDGLFWSPNRTDFYKVEYPEYVNKSRFFAIKNIYEDINGMVWIGCALGTFWIDFIDGIPHMIRARNYNEDPGLRREAVSFLDDGELFFIGTLQHGLFLYDKKNDFQNVKHLVQNNSNSGDLNSNRISYLLKDAKGQIWVGTYNGLHIFSRKDSTVQAAKRAFDIKGEFTGNIITCIDEDQNGNIWIGTANGLNKLSEKDVENKRFEVQIFTEEDGLSSNFIKGIAHDLEGNIWISTNVGISKLNPNQENSVINFSEKDGVLGTSFTEASVFQNSKGELFFGGTYGLTYFNPKEIEIASVVHKPTFTRLSVLNKPVKVGKEYDSNVILKKSISLSDEIVLSHHQDKLEIQFSALDFESGGKTNYKYILENFDNEWNYIGARRYIVFNNLKHGEYLLKVKCSNRHNVWSQEVTKLRIIIKPPIWKTWYALIFYILVITGLASIIRWNAVKQVRLSNELEMEKMKHERDHKLNEMKLRFFTNLSHEFRTPLTLILAPLKELLGNKEKYQLSKETHNKIGLVQNNSLRLMKLVNQLLDFRKVESGNMKLFASKTNLEEFVAEICHPFFELAKINNIKFELNTSLKTKSIWIDRDKFEVVINNLISNAFKFIQENGNIEVTLTEEDDVVLLSVSDNGPGIPESEINSIFEHFYRVGQNKGYGSSGIGLALVKRYAELHKGSISVISEANKLTKFTVILKKGTEHLHAEEILELENKETGFVLKEQFFSNALPQKEKQIAKFEDSVLIVEDNPEVNSYLVDILNPYYCVYSAQNGVEGFEMATEKVPSLIISDVMMPKMDGFEFCKKIRESDSLSTIPFIFLTAKSDEQFRLFGTQFGADDYLSKPFDPTLLLEKVKNILLNRKKLQIQYSKSIRLEPSEIEIDSADELFIEKVILNIEKNLQNQNFSADVLASVMNMSSSSLYRKLKALTNYSTAEFIRSIRLKRGAQLLADKERTITEIAYEIGLNDVKHFRTLFQKQFNCSPSEYRKKL